MSKGMKPAWKVGAKNAALTSQLGANGSSCNTTYFQTYFQLQLPAHRKLLALFKDEAASGSDCASHIALDQSNMVNVASAGMSMPAMR